MAQQHSIYNRPLKPQTERIILLCLRSLGAAALIVCIVFWISLLLR